MDRTTRNGNGASNGSTVTAANASTNGSAAAAHGTAHPSAPNSAPNSAPSLTPRQASTSGSISGTNPSSGSGQDHASEWTLARKAGIESPLERRVLMAEAVSPVAPLAPVGSESRARAVQAPGVATSEVLTIQPPRLAGESASRNAPLLERLVRGERQCAIIFAGQGIPYLEELRQLERTNRTAGELIRAASALIEETIDLPLFQRSGYFAQGFELLTWLRQPVLAPDEAYLSSSVVSQSLVFLLQCARYIALYDEGLRLAFEAGAVRALTGHSQGVMPALLVAEAPLGRLESTRVLELVRYYLYQGLHMQDSFGGLQPGLVREGDATPMAAISRLDFKTLNASVAALNQQLPESDQLFITLHNTRTRHVVSGPARALVRLRSALDARAEQEKKDKARGRFAGLPSAFDWEYLPVSGAFHSPYMTRGLARMRETARALNFKLDAGRLNLPVLSPSTGLPLNASADLTETLLQFQFLESVHWDRTLQHLSEVPHLTDVLDIGPGDAVSRLSAVCLRGSGIRVLPVALPSGQKVLLGEDLVVPELNYRQFQPQLVQLPDGKVCIDNAFTRFTGRSPIVLPGMTPTTVEAPIVAAAANGGFVAELAGGGQVTEAILRERMRELSESLKPGREVVFNALFLDPYLWGLHFKKNGLVVKLKQEGAPLCGVTISAGIPEVEEASHLLDELFAAGLWLNAFKPGTLAQLDAVLRIAEANRSRTLLIQLEGGKAGGHHSWEDLDQLLLERYHRIRQQSNLILCVGGGIADEARAVSLLTGTWAAAYGQRAMPVDAVFLGTLTMACQEAMTSPQVKAALVQAAGTDQWVFAGNVAGAITSGKSSLNADIHYLDNAASRLGRWLDQLAADPSLIQTKRAELIDALNATARPYFGDLEAMSYRDVLARMVSLMAIGRGGRYEDGLWPDRSYRERVADFIHRAEARICAQESGLFESILPDLMALDEPSAVLQKFDERYGSQADLPLHPMDIVYFIQQICRRPGKPINFVPVIDDQLRTWYKSDSLWQSHDDRYSADQVLVIPGPEAVRGIRQANEPVAQLLERFHQATVETLLARGLSAVARETRRYSPMESPKPKGVRLIPMAGDVRGLSVWIDQTPAPEGFFAFLADLGTGPLLRALRETTILTREASGTAPGRPNPLRALLQPVVGAELSLIHAPGEHSSKPRPPVSQLLYRLPDGETVGVKLQLETGRDGGGRGVLEISARGVSGPRSEATLTFELQWQDDGGVDLYTLEMEAFSRDLRRFYHRALFGVSVPGAVASWTVSSPSDGAVASSATGTGGWAGAETSLFLPVTGFASISEADVRAYEAVTGGNPGAMGPVGDQSSRSSQGRGATPISVESLSGLSLAEVARLEDAPQPSPVPLPINMAFTLAWEPLFQVISHELLAGGLLNLVHLSNRFEPGEEGWPVFANEHLFVEARLIRLEDRTSGRTLTTEVLIRRPGNPKVVLRLTSAFFIRGSFGHTPYQRLIQEPLNRSFTVTDAAALEFLSTHPLLRWNTGGVGAAQAVEAAVEGEEAAKSSVLSQTEGQAVQPGVLPLTPGQVLRWEGTLSEVVPRQGPARFGASVRLLRQGEEGNAEVLGVLTLEPASHPHERVEQHPVRALLDALEGNGLKSLEETIHPVTTRRLARQKTRAPRSLKTFAEVGRDANPLHLSPLMARFAGLEQPIVHGMWTSARAHSFLVETVAGGRAARVTRFETTFLAPTLPGEQLRFTATRTGVRHGWLEVEIAAHALRQPAGNGESAIGDALPGTVSGAGTVSPVQVMSAKALVAPPRTAYVFPGQGIQRPGMGMDGFARSAAARAVWERADLFTRESLGFSLLRVVRENPRELIVRGQVLVHEQGVLHLTQLTQVAMAVLAQAQIAELREAGLLVDDAITCGHSVGEYNTFGALAGVLPLETVIQMVYERGCTMHRLIPRDSEGESGFRMGVIRPHLARLDEAGAVALVARIARETGLPLQIVNYNIRGKQYSVTGRREALAMLEKVLAERTPPGAKGAYLEVPGIDTPFHSHLLQNGVADFRAALEARFPEHLPFARLLGRYIPNLVPKPFSLERAFIQEVADYTGSSILQDVLTHFAFWQATPEKLARVLLIELLSWQFASPVRWVETQELMLKPIAQGGLGVERVIEVGVGYQPTLANMARASLQVMQTVAAGVASMRSGKDMVVALPPDVQIFNIEADRDTVFCLDSDPPGTQDDVDAAVAPSRATAGTTAPSAASVSAPVSAGATPAAASPVPTTAATTATPTSSAVTPAAATPAAGPVADVPVTVEDSLRVLLALQARVRPEQVSSAETIDQLFEGVSSRRNQVLIDLGQEFGLGTLDGAHEKPLNTLVSELTGRARGWTAPGRYTRAAQDEALNRVLGPTGMTRKEVAGWLEKTWGLTGGLATGFFNTFSLTTRPGASVRGGTLGDLGSAAPTSRKDAETLLDQVVTLFASSRGLNLARAGTGAATGGDVVDAAAVRALSDQVLGPEGVLMRTARKLATELGHPLDPTQAEQESSTVVGGATTAGVKAGNAELQSQVSAELGADFLSQVQPRFSPRRHVAFTASYANARQALARFFYQGLAGHRQQLVSARGNGQDGWSEAGALTAEDAAIAQRLAPFASLDRPEFLHDARRFATMARHLAARAAAAGASALAGCLEQISKGATPDPLTGLGTFGTDILSPNACSAGRAVRFGRSEATHEALANVLASGVSQAFRFVGKTALVTGAGPGSIALEAVRQLLRGGARVVLTTSNATRERLGFYRKLYQSCATPESELHVVPFNQASMQDVEALIQWLFDPVTEQVGAQTRVLKRPFVPDLLLPFAAIGELATVDQLSGRSEVTLRTLLLAVERMIGAIASRFRRDGMGLPCHVILPLSPNHGGFGGDGAYAESKAALEVLLTKWHSERDAWGKYVTLCAARIGWVRSTGLMAGNDVLAGPLEAETGLRTFSNAEMGYLIAALGTETARHLARIEPLEADLTGGFSTIVDLKCTVDRIRQAQAREATLARKVAQLQQVEKQKLGRQGRRAVLSLQALPWWPSRPQPLPRVHATRERGTGIPSAQDRVKPLSSGDPVLDSALRSPAPNLPAPDPATVSGQSESASISMESLLDRLSQTSLRRTVVIVGTGEVSPWGSSRTRFEVEAEDRLSPAGVLELAWMTGLVRYEAGERSGSWIDVASGESVAEEALAERYEAEVRKRAGIRFMEREHTGFDPEAMTVLAPVHLEESMTFRVSTEAEALAFVRRDPAHTRIAADANRGDWTVTRLKGARIHVPRVTRMSRAVAGQVPTGLDFTRYGIPRDMVDNVDRLTLFNLVATVDAFLSAGLSPEELMSWVHPARVANTQGAGIGGMKSLQRLYTDHLVGKARQTDILQETLINVIAGYVVQSYIGSYGAMSHPVGACATAAVSVEDGYDKILAGKADFVISGGFDDIGIEGAIGFSDMNATADTDEMKAMGLEPGEMSRPNDVRRRGFVEGQGGGTLLLARGDLAVAMGLPVVGVVGYAASFGDGIQKSVPAPGLGILACAAGGRRSPLGEALRQSGLTADDIALVYKHDTSTGANDPNENNLHHEIQVALGRTEGNPLFVVSQKSLTGHSKGGAAAWQLLGLCQSLEAGLIPGNRNLDCLDPAMARYHHLVFSDATIHAGPGQLKAGLATSLGFGHVGAIVLVLGRQVFEAQLQALAGAEVLARWQLQVSARQERARRQRAEVWMGSRPAFEKRSHRRFEAPDGSEAQLREEIALLTHADARLDPQTRQYQRM